MPSNGSSGANEIPQLDLRRAAVSSYGALAAYSKDQLYLLQEGLIYTSPWIVTKATSRSSASVLLTARRNSFEISTDAGSGTFEAVAVKPLLERGLRAENSRLVSILVHPNHPHYRRFRSIPSPGYLPLPRDAFASLDASLDAAYSGDLTIDQATELLKRVVDCTARLLPRIKRADPRIERALELLQHNPGYPLSELAAAVGLSCDRMSHLFADVVGLPWRSYQLWQKIRTVGSFIGSGQRLTEIALAAGFTDSAHLSNTWQQAYGAPPSHFFNNEYVDVHFDPRLAAGSHVSDHDVLIEKHGECPHCGSTASGALDG